MTDIVAEARKVARALGWHPTPPPCMCWNCQANRALTTAADEIERLRADKPDRCGYCDSEITNGQLVHGERCNRPAEVK